MNKLIIKININIIVIILNKKFKILNCRIWNFFKISFLNYFINLDSYKKYIHTKVFYYKNIYSIPIKFINILIWDKL